MPPAARSARGPASSSSSSSKSAGKHARVAQSALQSGRAAALPHPPRPPMLDTDSSAALAADADADAGDHASAAAVTALSHARQRPALFALDAAHVLERWDDAHFQHAFFLLRTAQRAAKSLAQYWASQRAERERRRERAERRLLQRQQGRQLHTPRVPHAAAASATAAVSVVPSAPPLSARSQPTPRHRASTALVSSAATAATALALSSGHLPPPSSHSGIHLHEHRHHEMWEIPHGADHMSEAAVEAHCLHTVVHVFERVLQRPSPASQSQLALPASAVSSASSASLASAATAAANSAQPSISYRPPPCVSSAYLWPSDLALESAPIAPRRLVPSTATARRRAARASIAASSGMRGRMRGQITAYTHTTNCLQEAFVFLT